MEKSCLNQTLPCRFILFLNTMIIISQLNHSDIFFPLILLNKLKPTALGLVGNCRRWRGSLTQFDLTFTTYISFIYHVQFTNFLNFVLVLKYIWFVGATTEHALLGQSINVKHGEFEHLSWRDCKRRNWPTMTTSASNKVMTTVDKLFVHLFSLSPHILCTS